jgi:hypothetical protein
VQDGLRAFPHKAGTPKPPLNFGLIMPWARQGHTYVAYALGLLVVVQFFLAGLGAVELGNEGMDAHKGVGHLLEVGSLILLILAVLARYRGALLGMSIAVFVLVVLQNVWANMTVSVLAALHVIGALAIAMTLREILAKKKGPDVVRHTTFSGPA